MRRPVILRLPVEVRDRRCRQPQGGAAQAREGHGHETSGIQEGSVRRGHGQVPQRHQIPQGDGCGRSQALLPCQGPQPRCRHSRPLRHVQRKARVTDGFWSRLRHGPRQVRSCHLHHLRRQNEGLRSGVVHQGESLQLRTRHRRDGTTEQGQGAADHRHRQLHRFQVTSRRPHVAQQRIHGEAATELPGSRQESIPPQHAHVLPLLLVPPQALHRHGDEEEGAVRQLGTPEEAGIR
mmetsp:Transcript_11106/g.30706  ORF Transcript_11106/g.30706 Transcript_11106/m.30706 type:complete len:236 (-) Transcript_11106:748-1455(-)